MAEEGHRGRVIPEGFGRAGEVEHLETDPSMIFCHVKPGDSELAQPCPQLGYHGRIALGEVPHPLGRAPIA